METTSWPLVVFGIPGLVFPFLFSLTGYRGIVILQGLGTLFVPGFPCAFGYLFLLILDVRLGLEEEGVERGRCLNAYSFCKVTTGTKPALEEIFLHVISC